MTACTGTGSTCSAAELCVASIAAKTAHSDISTRPRPTRDKAARSGARVSIERLEVVKTDQLLDFIDISRAALRVALQLFREHQPRQRLLARPQPGSRQPKIAVRRMRIDIPQITGHGLAGCREHLDFVCFRFAAGARHDAASRFIAPLAKEVSSLACETRGAPAVLLGRLGQRQ